MNIIFLFIVLIAFVTTGWHQFFTTPATGQLAPMEALSKAMVDSATGSVELAFGLVGVMTLFLGLMKVAEMGGLLTVIARLIRPLMTRLFPEVPPEHPAMGAMILNLSANVLGLGNAATPFGIRAMQELNRLNPAPGTATDAMALFLAINTSSVTLLPTGVIALRAAAGSARPRSSPRPAPPRPPSSPSSSCAGSPGNHSPAQPMHLRRPRRCQPNRPRSCRIRPRANIRCGRAFWRLPAS
jgi:spore maturation protein SpmA